MQKIKADSSEAKSADIIADNVAKLRTLFPELITEAGEGVSINLDVLKQLVGHKIVTEADEKYGLNWHGKRAARQLALTPSTGTLRPCPADSVDWDLTQNLMIEGDNLEILKLLQKSYSRKVKVIYIDPPYNTGKDFVYPDNFQDNIKNYETLMGWRNQEGERVSSLASIKNTEASGRFHTDWLNMMYPRLKLARNLLREDGVIFITIDDHEVAGLKTLCDELFGEENCQGILVWQHSLQPKGYSGTFSVHHNFILCYQKGEDFELTNLGRTEENNKNYSNPDNDPNGAWRAGDVRNALYRPNLIYPITTPSGKIINPPSNGWRWSKETMTSKIASGEIVFSPDETRIIRKIYLNSLDGRTPETILFGKDVGTTRDAASEVKDLFDGSVPFDTPKPTALIQHLLTLSGARGDDIILDFFAGSGTSAQAVWQQNVRDEKRLRVILAQLPEPLDPRNAEQITAAELCDRIGKPRNIAELTKERLRRAGKSIREKNAMFAGDVGFRVFKLASSNIQAWEPDRDRLAETLEASVEHLKTDRTEQDILYELLIKLGLDVCVPIHRAKILGADNLSHDIHSIGGGSLLVCLSTAISDADAEPLALGLVAWHKSSSPAGATTIVCRDSAFGNDVTKTNFTAILQQHGLENVRSI